jgi:hypothetical protein
MEDDKINDWEDVEINDWQDVPVDSRTPTSEESSLSNLDVSGLAALQSLSFGGADELKAALEAPFSDKTYEQIRDEERALYKKAEETNPSLYNTVSFGAGFVPAVATGGLGLVKSGISAAKSAPSMLKSAQAAAPSLAKLTGIGAAQGAVQGLGSSEADNNIDLVSDMLTGAEIGGGVGLGLGVTLPVAGKAVSYAAPKIKDFVSGLPLVKPFLRSRELKKQGIDVTSEKAGKRIIKESEKLAKDMQQTLENIYKASSKGVGKILKRSSDQGLEADISQDLVKIEKSIQNTNPATAEGRASLQELQSLVDKYKQNKQLLKKPNVPVKTGEEKALEKLTKKQAKMIEEARLKGEDIAFTEPEISEEFVKSSTSPKIKPMVEAVPTGEVSPVKFIETPEIVRSVVRPQTLAKTGEELALEKLLQKQAKMTEEARVINELAESRVTEDLADDAVIGVEPFKFTDPEVGDEFISSAAFTDNKIKPMVETIPTGEFNPVKFTKQEIPKYTVQRPATPVKTGQEEALEKLLQTQAKLKEQMSLQGKPVQFTEPEIGEQFIKSSQITPGKPMAEPITSGEFSPIEIINQPELVANLNAQELQTLKRQIADISSKQDIGDIASKRIQQAKVMVDDALKQRAIAPELVPALERVNKQIGATKDVAGLVNKDLLNYMNPTEKQQAINDFSQFLRKPSTGTTGDNLAQQKELFFNTLKKVMPTESAENVQKLANQLAEQYEYNLASRNIFGGVSLKDPGSLFGTGKGLAVRAGQFEGAIENAAASALDAVQLDRTLARALSKPETLFNPAEKMTGAILPTRMQNALVENYYNPMRSVYKNALPNEFKDVLKQYDQARLQNMTLNTALRKPAENVVESRNDERQEFMTKGMDGLNKANVADLQAFSESLITSGKAGAEKYANTLNKLAQTEAKNRAPLTFSLMSDPNFRQLYKDQISPFGVEENEE